MEYYYYSATSVYVLDLWGHASLSGFHSKNNSTYTVYCHFYFSAANPGEVFTPSPGGLAPPIWGDDRRLLNWFDDVGWR